DVETTIVCAAVERATHGDAFAVAASSGEADPVSMRRRLSGVAYRLERAAVVGDDVARVMDRLGHPQLDERQLTRCSLLARRPRHLWVALKAPEDLGQDVNHEVVFGGNALLDTPIDVIERELRRVEPALARPWLFALSFLAPPAI